MSSDPIEASPQLSARRTPGSSPAGRALLLAGVAAACVLGVAAGMWARPAEHERHAAMRAQAKTAVGASAKPALQIVVDERPAPLGQPLEVMPAASAPPLGAAQSGAIPAEVSLEELTPLPAVPAAEMAPRSPPNGLLRVQAISSPPSEAAPSVVSAPPPAAAPTVKPAKPAPKPVAKAAAPAAKRVVDKPSAKPAPAKPKLTVAVARTAKPAPRAAAKLVKTSAPAKAKPERNSAVARENAALRARLLKAEARLAKAERSARPKLAAAVRSLKASTRTQKAVAPAKARTVAAKRAPTPSVRPVGEPRLTKIVARRTVAPPKPAVKVVKAQARPQGRCASADAAQALVCRDPSLGAADRELGRAYRQAEAAGVPSWRLAQQQQRWAAARANAAREAPWAVRDVYQAQIAQLRDMSQRAQSEN